MIDPSVCEFCGAWGEEHGYEHSARVCFPIQVKDLEKQLAERDATIAAWRDLLERLSNAFSPIGKTSLAEAREMVSMALLEDFNKRMGKRT